MIQRRLRIADCIRPFAFPSRAGRIRAAFYRKWTQSMAEVTLEHVTKSFPGGVQAVRDLTLTVEDGEFLVLVGPSGCGKSTALRCIAGLEEVTEGVIRIGRRVVNDLEPKDRDVAMVFQSYALYPHMTVRENIAFPLRMRRVPAAEVSSRVGEAADILGLGALLDRRPRALSGGQQQRVALGRALVRKPAVFLFDEPLSNLDAKLRTEMRTEIARIHREVGGTMIYVTHDQAEAMILGDRIAVLENGVLQQLDAPLTVFDRPVNRFVAGFLGTPSINFLEGRLERATTFVAGEDRLALPRVPAERVDGPVLLGIRPQHVRAEAETEEPAISGTVETLEHLGSEAFVHADTAGGRLVATVDLDFRPAHGDRIRLVPRSDCILLFDPDDGRALT